MPEPQFLWVSFISASEQMDGRHPAVQRFKWKHFHFFCCCYSLPPSAYRANDRLTDCFIWTRLEIGKSFIYMARSYMFNNRKSINFLFTLSKIIKRAFLKTEESEWMPEEVIFMDTVNWLTTVISQYKWHNNTQKLSLSLFLPVCAKDGTDSKPQTYFIVLHNFQTCNRIN